MLPASLWRRSPNTRPPGWLPRPRCGILRTPWPTRSNAGGEGFYEPRNVEVMRIAATVRHQDSELHGQLVGADARGELDSAILLPRRAGLKQNAFPTLLEGIESLGSNVASHELRPCGCVYIHMCLLFVYPHIYPLISDSYFLQCV